MNKIFTLPALLALFLSPVVLAESINEEPIKLQAEKHSTESTFTIIVKFKDKNIHQSLLSTPETTKLLSTKMASESAINNISHFKKTYNLESNVSAELGLKQLSSLRAQYQADFAHQRSMALGADLITVTADSSLAAQGLVDKMLDSGDFEHVMLNYQVKKQTFNDPYFNEQEYLHAHSHSNLYGQDYVSMRNQTLNNLGRKIRIGIVDTGSATHEDINDRIEGYDFLTTSDDDRLLADEVRDDNPDDVSTLADGSLCHDGHGLSVASLIAAKSNNGLGITGAVEAEQVDLIYARVLDCFGDGSSSGVLDAVAWMSGESVPGVPDISEKVDIINLSLGGNGTCASYTQSVYDKARENGVTVFVAAGNNNVDAQSVSPAACNNVISVGATTNNGDKASFSNYGEYVDIMSAGDSVWMLQSNEFVERDELYFRGSGTSMATPNAAAGAANLLLTYPELTPAEVEAMMKANGAGYAKASLCGQLGCGAGAVDMGQLMGAMSGILTNSDYAVVHRYEGFDTAEQTTWLQAMNEYIGSCNLIKYTWGDLGHARAGVSYKLYKVHADAEPEVLETIAEPQKIITKITGGELAVQACENSTCGAITEMSAANIIYPASCQ